MTPREPDRFDAQARELLDIINDGPNDRLGNIAAALRAAESSALNAVRQYVEARPECSQLAMLRLLDDLIPPAAAPAADPIHEAYLAADEYGQPPQPAAETGKAQGAQALDTALALECAKDAHFKDQLEHEERATKLAAAEKRIAELERDHRLYAEWAASEFGRRAWQPNETYDAWQARIAARAAPPEREGNR